MGIGQRPHDLDGSSGSIDPPAASGWKAGGSQPLSVSSTLASHQALEKRVRLGLVLDQPVTGRAVPPRLDHRAADLMSRCLAGESVASAPVGAQAKRTGELQAAGRQLVRGARGRSVYRRDTSKPSRSSRLSRADRMSWRAMRRCSVRPTVVWRDPGDLIKQVVEPSRAVERRLCGRTAAPSTNGSWKASSGCARCCYAELNRCGGSGTAVGLAGTEEVPHDRAGIDLLGNRE